MSDPVIEEGENVEAMLILLHAQSLKHIYTVDICTYYSK